MQGIHSFRRKERAANEHRHRRKSWVYAVVGILADIVVYGGFGLFLLGTAVATIPAFRWWSAPLVLLGLWLAISIWIPMIRGWVSLWRFWSTRPGTAGYTRMPPQLVGNAAQDPWLVSMTERQGGLLISCTACGDSKTMRLDKHLRRTYSGQRLKQSLQRYVFCRSHEQTRPDCACTAELLQAPDPRLPPEPTRA
ncbi:hypothetical protein [Falsiroseomonas sp. E2-1-a4]|uniref:hypothetical protein n=1 Tax=Falsiroseomonas sp. E2-1-a4 TaxID=3239299 RepID=UPI003F3B3DEA